MGYNRSTFPENGYDIFDENYDPSYPQLLELNEWQTLKAKSSRTVTEENRFQELTSTYARYIFTPEKLNKLQDVITSTQKFTYETITNYYKFMGEHSMITNYKAFNTVRYNGNGYLALKDNVGILPTDESTWLLVGGQGAKGDTGDKGTDGVNGVGLKFLGDYSNTKAYNLDEAVRYNNKIYYCIQASVGNLPTNTTYWKIFLEMLPTGFVESAIAPQPQSNQIWINTNVSS